MKGILIAALALALFALLYDRGLMALKINRVALMFRGSWDARRASFARCSGQLRRVVRFDRDGAYCFTLDANLTAGGMSVCLTDGERREVLRLDEQHPAAQADVRRGARYVMVIRFDAASGEYALDWQ
ncbi:MAG: hypothetical protein J6K32_00650 [Clostridia bacterium]|nr:hypothetical protein [Clostridia bacterium]